VHEETHLRSIPNSDSLPGCRDFDGTVKPPLIEKVK
jgi:hypothetical protein